MWRSRASLIGHLNRWRYELGTDSCYVAGHLHCILQDCTAAEKAYVEFRMERSRKFLQLFDFAIGPGSELSLEELCGLWGKFEDQVKIDDGHDVSMSRYRIDLLRTWEGCRAGE
jgi:hypothetical protein